MLAQARRFFIVLSFTFILLTLAGGLVFSYYTLDAKDDAGKTFGQAAYAQFVDQSGSIYQIDSNYFSSPTSAADIDGIARAMGVGWTEVRAEGNIWSSDKIVGDSYHFTAGTYRIDAVSGGFLYDSFAWSPVQNEPLQWSMNIRAQLDSGVYSDTTMLGTFLAKDVGTLPLYTYVTLEGPGWLEFWIGDWNSIDNSGRLTFSVTSVPEPSTLPFLAGILVLSLLPRARRRLARQDEIPKEK